MPPPSPRVLGVSRCRVSRQAAGGGSAARPVGDDEDGGRPRLPRPLAASTSVDSPIVGCS
ncbi:hypothetical protein BU14_1630s0001 [Porphyra umbilicalis]|uniref:Uncharacterized protein n=1 Tax=Porphyra umbilicalis TaxID=2786 RepID=A0A1X6NL37_PORUM|nr:hypothetical protein BU14_1630s0001 [Porphyra umbilicalis]|eukprot:OSX69308.1 hypothetical protein BU14_1630s0001 [Porphyra umbilicalis]